MARRVSRTRIVIAPDAAKHLDDDIEYLARYATIEIALSFQLAVARELERLREFPELGSPRPGVNLRLEGLRMRPVEGFQNWLIYYIVTEQILEVLWILHAAEDRDRILSQGP